MALSKIFNSYQILGLKIGASPGEVRRAYLDLVKKCHPDKFIHDSEEQRKTQEKLIEINQAYNDLRVYFADPNIFFNEKRDYSNTTNSPKSETVSPKTPPQAKFKTIKINRPNPINQTVQKNELQNHEPNRLKYLIAVAVILIVVTLVIFYTDVPAGLLSLLG